MANKAIRVNDFNNVMTFFASNFETFIADLLIGDGVLGLAMLAEKSHGFYRSFIK